MSLAHRDIAPTIVLILSLSSVRKQTLQLKTAQSSAPNESRITSVYHVRRDRQDDGGRFVSKQNAKKHLIGIIQDFEKPVDFWRLSKVIVFLNIRFSFVCFHCVC